jgi:hypothetical protein
VVVVTNIHYCSRPTRTRTRTIQKTKNNNNNNNIDNDNNNDEATFLNKFIEHRIAAQRPDLN